jgi:lysophospholipase L1-like esterase
MSLRLALLGDSIAAGVGAADAADTLAPRLAAELAAAGLPALACVFAVPGAVSADLGRQVVRARAWPPDVAVVVVGANDLTRLVPAAQAAGHLRRAVRELRGLGAEVVLAPAPDLSVVPSVPAMVRHVVRAGSALLRHAQVRVTLDEGGRVADADAGTSAAFARDPSLFSTDRFHPSSAGYAAIAAALAPVVRAAAEHVHAVRRAG